MITILTRDNLRLVQNEGLRKDAERYLENYDDYVQGIKEFGMTVSDIDDTKETEALTKELIALGVRPRNKNKSFLWGGISPSCEHCVTGEGSVSLILSLACNRDCFFCTNKNQYNYEHRRKTVADLPAEYKKMYKYHKKMRSAAITGGEPLLYPDECEKFIRYVRKRDKDIYTRIYSNGDLATEEVLTQLKKAGLDEIRFGLKPDEDGIVEEAVLKNLENAIKIIPNAMVEMPPTPGKLDAMIKLFDKLEEIGVKGINILEFLFPWVHVKEYNEQGYKVKRRPYEVLYGYHYAGGIPLAGSELDCLKLVKHAAENKFKMGVHYCSLENKLTSQIWRYNTSFKKGPLEFFSETDFFVKSAKAYGADAEKVKTILDEKGSDAYSYNVSEQNIDFPVKDIPLLKGENMQLGISYMVFEIDEEKRGLIREIAIQLTDTESFEMSDL